jgi:Ca-activated chloride channel homolog
VLERLEDYVQHRITPPDELKNEYFAAIEKIETETKTTEQSHLEEIATKFKDRKEWWNTKFKFGTPEIVKKKMNKSMDRDGDRGGDGEESPLSIGASPNRSAEYSAPEAAPPPATDEKKEDAAAGSGDGSITLKKWEPDTPYLTALKVAPEQDLNKEYLKQKKEYANSSAFYLDVADFYIEKGKKAEALRILSNIAELDLENHQLLRILGYRLKQLGYYKLAIYVFEEVLKIRNEEPQSYRDLALAFEADKQYVKAADMFWYVVRNKWDDRFPDIELITLNELNSMLATCGTLIDPAKFDKRLIFNMPVDMRVILTWDADMTDMDLWVTDPNGEKCFYSNNKTYIGAIMSRDFTRGYGPEEFLLKKAQPGKYTIEVNYYGNTQQVLAGATTIQVMLTTNFGIARQKTQEITLRLKDKKEVINVGEFDFKP